MRGHRRVGIRTYRHHRLELLDDGAEGWVVSVRRPGDDGSRAVLRNKVPNGLSLLIEEAKFRVDRRLDGADWQRAP